MSTDLRLGILGLSEGNGHPYSWAAICNGYDPDAMRDCPFPVIPAYLGKQRFPEDALDGARVTHVWTQDRAVSEHVAKAALIPKVVERHEAMIGEVDGVLLARDDPETHYELSRPFLDAGLPVYVDKPLALSVAEAEALYALERWPGQLFTCTALRYARELSPEAASSTGAVRHLQASVIKDWDKYGVHVLEPALRILRVEGPPATTVAFAHADRAVVCFGWRDGPSLAVTTLGKGAAGGITLAVHGADGHATLAMQDTFSAFKAALAAFVAGMRERRPMIPKAEAMQVIDLIERGRRALGAA